MIDIDFIDRENSMTHLFRWSIYLVPLHIISSICIGKTEYMQTGKFVDHWVAIESRRTRQLLLFFTNHLKISYLFYYNSFEFLFWLRILAKFVGAQFSQFRYATLLKYCWCSSGCSYIPQIRDLSIITPCLVLSWTHSLYRLITESGENPSKEIV